LKLIEDIMEPETAGDPMGKSLNRTRKSTYSLSETLKTNGISISPNTAGDILKVQGYSLRSNRKSISTTQHPDRDQQFRHIGLVFINDGARWIWNYIEERYPNSIQILDFFHCKEHICQFAKEFFGNTQQASDFSEQLCNMLLEEKVDGAIETLRGLEPQSKRKNDVSAPLLNDTT